MGKPIRVAHEIELRALTRTLRYYGELADKEHGEITPTGEGELSLVTREPAGVVAAVTAPPVAAYTAVLLADTATPSWHEAHRELPFVFVGSAAAAAGGLGLLALRTSCVSAEAHA